MGLLYEAMKAIANLHWRRCRDQDTTGVNHGVMELKHPTLGVLALACLCGRVFWSQGCFRNEIVKREDFDTDEEYRVALRTQFGVRASDISPQKARKVRGLGRKKDCSRSDWPGKGSSRK